MYTNFLNFTLSVCIYSLQLTAMEFPMYFYLLRSILATLDCGTRPTEAVAWYISWLQESLISGPIIDLSAGQCAADTCSICERATYNSLTQGPSNTSNNPHNALRIAGTNCFCRYMLLKSLLTNLLQWWYKSCVALHITIIAWVMLSIIGHQYLYLDWLHSFLKI